MTKKNKQVFFAEEIHAITQNETQTLVFSHIAYHIAKHKKFNSSVSAIATYLHYSVNAVKQAIIALVEHELIIEKLNESNYNRKITFNEKHRLYHSLMNSYLALTYTKTIKKTAPNHMSLYSVNLDLISKNKSKDSRHEHKKVMLDALLREKIESNAYNTNNKNTSYHNSIAALSKRFHWSYMTVKRLIDSITNNKLLKTTATKVKKITGFIFEFIKKTKKFKTKQKQNPHRKGSQQWRVFEYGRGKPITT